MWRGSFNLKAHFYVDVYCGSKLSIDHHHFACRGRAASYQNDRLSVSVVVADRRRRANNYL